MDEHATTSPKGQAGRDLPVAIGVGLGLAAVFVATLLIEPLAFITWVALIVTVGIVELGRAFTAAGYRPATIVVWAAGMVAVYGAYLTGEQGQYLGLAVLVLGASLRVLAAPDRPQVVVASLGVTFLMAIWVPFLASYVGLLLRRPEGHWFVLMATALTVTNDVAAYGFGRPFGRTRLAPAISPGKTWEGLVGGAATTLLVAATISVWTVPGLTLVPALVVAAGIVAAAVVGDLFESLIKRDLRVKDLGTVLPGHGGVMDRMDALLFSLPMAHHLLVAVDL